MSLIVKAASFAAKKHEGQYRKLFEKRPYFTHVAMVAGRIAAWADQYPGVKPDDLVAVGFLHDVVEDCDVTIDDIKSEFNSEVGIGVWWLTSYSKILHSKEKRAIRKQLDRDHLAVAPVHYKRAKLEDRCSNMEDVIAKAEPDFALLYADESEQLLSVIKEGDLKTADYLSALIQQVREKYKG
jgi:GTP pyrophosphokinase